MTLNFLRVDTASGLHAQEVSDPHDSAAANESRKTRCCLKCWVRKTEKNKHVDHFPLKYLRQRYNSYNVYGCDGNIIRVVRKFAPLQFGNFRCSDLSAKPLYSIPSALTRSPDTSTTRRYVSVVIIFLILTATAMDDKVVKKVVVLFGTYARLLQIPRSVPNNLTIVARKHVITFVISSKQCCLFQ